MVMKGPSRDTSGDLIFQFRGETMTASKYITTDCYEQIECFRTPSEFSVTNAFDFTAEFI